MSRNDHRARIRCVERYPKSLAQFMIRRQIPVIFVCMRQRGGKIKTNIQRSELLFPGEENEEKLYMRLYSPSLSTDTKRHAMILGRTCHFYVQDPSASLRKKINVSSPLPLFCAVKQSMLIPFFFLLHYTVSDRFLSPHLYLFSFFSTCCVEKEQNLSLIATTSYVPSWLALITFL